MTAAVFIKRWLFLGLLLVLASCVGQQGGGSGGTGSPVVSSGSVTGFGSIFVNGTEFDIPPEATVTINDQPGSEADLRLGQVVIVQGTLGANGVTGTADTVVYEDHAVGPIESINVAMKRLVVLGQLVLVTDATQFGDTPLRNLEVGNVVTLSGFEDALGRLRATRVEKTQDALTPGFEIEATGVVMALDNVNQTFALNMLSVDFSAAVLVNAPGGQLVNGQVVEVTSSQNVVDGVLLAERVKVQSVGIQGAAGDAAELQGVITQVTSSNAFQVNGQPVRITPDTRFEKGSADDIAINVLVEIEGVFDADGEIIARELEFSAGEELRGTITRVTSSDRFEVDGQPVRMTPDTFIHPEALDDIAVGAQVEVDGFFNSAGVLVATEVEFFLEGTITAISAADTFEIGGQIVRFTSATVFDQGSVDDLVVGAQVETEGYFDAADVFVATEIGVLP